MFKIKAGVIEKQFGWSVKIKVGNQLKLSKLSEVSVD